MPEFLHHASDDQLALAICGCALLLSGMIMYFSHHLGRKAGNIRLHDDTVHRMEPTVQKSAAATHTTLVARDKAA
jgi:hypothetical protein